MKSLDERHADRARRKTEEMNNSKNPDLLRGGATRMEDANGETSGRSDDEGNREPREGDAGIGMRADTQGVGDAAGISPGISKGKTRSGMTTAPGNGGAEGGTKAGENSADWKPNA